MKKQYIQPITDVVDICLKGAVLEELPLRGGASGERAMTMWGNEGSFDGQEEGSSNFWDD